jgi:hypothetical protein
VVQGVNASFFADLRVAPASAFEHYFGGFVEPLKSTCAHHFRAEHRHCRAEAV